MLERSGIFFLTVSRRFVGMRRFLFLVVAGVLGLSVSAGVAGEKKPILIVLTNHSQLGNTGTLTGFFLSEAAHPWRVFSDAGYAVVLASPRGGFAPIDPKSLGKDDGADVAFLKKYGSKVGGSEGVADTVALSAVKPGEYSAVFFAGGHGAMWDFPRNAEVGRVIRGVYENGGVVGAVCHGPAALVGATLSDGVPIVRGRELAVFTDAEERAVKLEKTVPFLLESTLNSEGGMVKPAANFEKNAVRDGRLVTGQNPASATRAAELVVEGLK